MKQEKIVEIKECLENCINDCGATSCPYNTYEKGLKCIEDLQKDTLILINELESENEKLKKISLNENITVGEYLREMQRLKKDNELLRNAKVVYENVDYCAEDLKKAKDRIAELEKENAIKTDTIVDLLKKQEFYEKEKLKQFAESLEEKVIRPCDLYDCVTLDDIDETLKEFIKY